MKYLIPAILIPALAIVWLADRDYLIEQEQYQTMQDNLRTQIAIIDSLRSRTDSLQALVDVCDARVDDMRWQRDHAIETNRWHQARMMRVRP